MAAFLALPRWARAASIALVAGALPLVALGPGTDLDVAAVIESGRLIRGGDYRPSRPPGAPVHEAIVGVLEGAGGVVLSNLATLAASVLAAGCLYALARQQRLPRPELVTAVLVSNPWFLVAATSTVDFPFALAGVLGGALALRANRAFVAGACFGLAIGCRSSSVLAVAAAVVADFAGESAAPRRALRAAALGVAIGAVCYVPAFVSADGSLAFAQNDFRTAGPATMLGRALAKDFYFLGPFAAVALIAAAPALWRALKSWRTSFVVRFGALIVLFVQALFLRFPWKMGHLLPLLAGLALLLGWALRERPALLGAFVALQLVYGVINLQLLEPDNPNKATGARAVFDVRWGVVVTDIACRAEDTAAWRTGERTRLEAVWNCAKPFGDGP